MLAPCPTAVALIPRGSEIYRQQGGRVMNQ